jgi:hypothetical protein|tara:strand:+ start:640 stop:879 length:240 start_codon:yes stop_codon:yes gene_type:complete
LKQEFDKKTLELLLVNYTNINNDLRKPCAIKSHFEQLIKETTEAIALAKDPIVYKDGMNALEFAIHLAQERNGKANSTD